MGLGCRGSSLFGGEGAGQWAGTGYLGSRGEEQWWDIDSVPAGECDEGQNCRRGAEMAPAPPSSYGLH